MQGREMLDRCPKDVKDVIIKHFNSLDGFYAYVYHIGVRQHEGFKRTHQIDPTEEYNLTDFLEQAGIDSLLAEDLVTEIINDFNQLLAEDYVKIKLGPDWKKIIATFEAMINNRSI